MTRIGFYPGTFDPPTLGHRNVFARAARLVDKLVIGVGVNPGKSPVFSAEERVALVQAEVAGLQGQFEVKSFSGLVVQFAKSVGASVVIKGLRSITDFDYEAQMAGMNAAMTPDVETVFLFAGTGTQAIASSHVRDIARMGGDVTPFVSQAVAKKLLQKVAATRQP